MIARLWKRLPKAEGLKNTAIHRLLGNTLFRRELWQFKPHRMAGGVALGLFIAFTPTPGVQMLLAAGFSVVLRVNLPLSLALTWLTNPFTTAFIYYSCYLIGAIILGLNVLTSPEEFLEIKLKGLIELLPALWLGGIILGGLTALIGYWVVLWVATLERKSRLGALLRQRVLKRKRFADDGVSAKF